MIARVWSARAAEPRSKDYLEHFKLAVLPQLSSLSGYAGSSVLTRAIDDEIEITVITVWRSLDAVKQFAGPDYESAVVADEAAAVLTGFDRRVRHFDLALVDVAQGIP